MATYTVGFDPLTKTATIFQEGDSIPENADIIGTFEHNDDEDPLGHEKNHVFYHHVRDLLYPLKVWDMQSVTILFDGSIDVSGVTLTPATASLIVGGTQQLTATVTPAVATNKNVSFTSSAPAVATVSATGLVTAVAEGTASIEVRTEDGEWTDTTEITVTAE